MSYTQSMTSDHNAQLFQLRRVLRERKLDGFIIPRADEHLSEYVPESAERLAFISGFTGSAGMAIVLMDQAAIFSDGRYSLQLETQTDGAFWQRRHITENPPEAWLAANAAASRIGYDPWLISADGLKRFTGVEMVPVDANPVDEIWQNQPPAPKGPAVPHELAFTGEDAAAKRVRLAQALRDAGQDAALLTDPASLAWLFNIRGSDVEFTPVVLGFAILNADATAVIFMAAEKLPSAMRAFLGDTVTIKDRAALPAALAALAGKTVRYDSAAMPVWFKTKLEQAGAKIAEAPDLAALPRACKNAVEQDGARAAHLRDAVAMVRFLAWLAAAEGETEISAAAKLLELRATGENFRGESFPAISSAGEHGTIIHYRVTPETDRALKPNELYLIDSGAQYLDGTTDITRTVWTGPGQAPDAVKDHATRVLAGHIALAQAIFPVGVAGAHLDALARNALWQAGLDYDHGTGHGVGSYLSVHEGPPSISRAARLVPLQPGMILSNEPGYYLPGAYGIRLENLVLVQPADFAVQLKKFLHFETLTLVPFDRALIEPELLTPDAVEWLNMYHARVRLLVGAHLHPDRDAEIIAWLSAATKPI